MNKNILLVAAFSCFAAFGFAQIKVVAPNGDVGIGTSSPTQKLDVAGNATISGNLGVGTDNPARQVHLRSNNAVFRLDRKGTSAPGFILNNATGPGAAEKVFFFGVPASGVNDGYFYIGDYGTSVSGNSVRRFVVDNDGDVIIGSSTNISSGYRLHVEGSAFKTDGNSNWNIISDMRTKKNVRTYRDGLAEILKMSPIKYEYNGKVGTPLNQEFIGVSAQALKEICPDMVSDFKYTFDDGIENMDQDKSKDDYTEENYLTINTSSLQWMLVNAIKEQQKQIDEKDELLESLENRLADIEYLVSELSSGSTQNVQIVGDVDSSVLHQNEPNPYSGSTRIRYSISSEANEAILNVLDSQGKILKTINVENSVNGEINLEVQNLPSGTYMYQLIVDGNLIDAKKMNLTK